MIKITRSIFKIIKKWVIRIQWIIYPCRRSKVLIQTTEKKPHRTTMLPAWCTNTQRSLTNWSQHPVPWYKDQSQNSKAKNTNNSNKQLLRAANHTANSTSSEKCKVWIPSQTRHWTLFVVLIKRRCSTNSSTNIYTKFTRTKSKKMKGLMAQVVRDEQITNLIC